MKDPYSILGVSRNVGDEEVKRAYRELARKYHPDNYANNPLADLAQEKMKEINEAYEQITRERSAGGAQQQYASYASYNPGSGSGSYTSGAYADARAAINAGELSRAEIILASVVNHDAEWNFLMGSLCYRRGWMDEAARYFSMAVTMNPQNPEYRQAHNYMTSNHSKSAAPASNVDPCRLCSNLMIADCCCEMVGCDLIRCI